MKRILNFIRAWRRDRILRELAKVDLALQLAQYGWDTSLWCDEEDEMVRLQARMAKLEAKLERLV